MPETTSEVFHADFKVEVLEAKENKADGTGRVKALVSAYERDYQMGYDVFHNVQKGAFSASLADAPVVPVFWQHNWSSTEQPPIGIAKGAETGTGLIVEADFFLDSEAGRSVFNAIKAKAIREWSIGYAIQEYSIAERDDDAVTLKITKAELLEASSVLRGANPHTDTLSAAAEVTAVKFLTEAVKAQAEINKAQTQANETQAGLIASLEADIVELTSKVEALAETAREAPQDPPTPDPVVEDESGKEAVEPAPSGDESKPSEAAAASASPQVPDFLPPSAESTGDARNDVTAITRVMAAMNRGDFERRAEVQSLISRRG